MVAEVENFIDGLSISFQKVVDLFLRVLHWLTEVRHLNRLLFSKKNIFRLIAKNKIYSFLSATMLNSI